MLEVGQTLAKSTVTEQTLKSAKTDNAKIFDTNNVTKLSNMPISNIGINIPIPFTETPEINILNEIKAKTYKLANGQKIIIIPKKGPTIVKTYVNVGSMNEPDDLRGISHYIEHNLFNGTQTLKAGEFFNKVNKLGASTNAATGFSMTNYFILSQLLKQGALEEKIKIHADMLQNPIFAPDMLEKERGPVISEISMVMDEPTNIATNLAIKNLYQIKSKSPDLIAGTIENIKNVTRNDVLKYYNTHYTPDNFITVISGDVNPDETIQLIAKYFTKKNNTKPTQKKFEPLFALEKPIRMDLTSDKAQVSSVITAFAGPQNNNTKDKIATEVLLTLLSSTQNSKLQKALDTLHLNIEAGIETIGNKPADQKAIIFMLNCTPEKTNDAIEKIYKEIFNLQNGKISKEELNIAKKHLKNGLNDIIESSSMLNNLIGNSLLDNDLNYITNYEKILDSLTIEDIQEAAKKYLNLNKVSIAVVNPNKNIEHKKNAMVTFGNKNSHYLKKEVFDTSKIKTYRLNNNIEIIANPGKSNSSSFTFTLTTPNPAAIKPGVAEILSGMLNRGTNLKSKEEFFNEAENNGINFSFSATPNEITVTTKSNYDAALKQLQLTKEVLFNPNLTQENFEFVKEQLKEIITAQPKTATLNAYSKMFKHLPYTASKEDFLESLKTLTLDDVKGLYVYILQNASGVCTVNAPFQKYENLINIFFSELSSNIPKMRLFEPQIFNTYIPIKKNTIIAQADQRNQADISKCFKFKTNGNIADLAKFSLLDIILGGTANSRLFNDLREKQKLAYRVRSNIDYIGNTGVMSLNIKTTTDDPNEAENKLNNLSKALKGFDKNINLLTTTLVTDEELDSAKLYLKTKILNEAETSSGQSDLLSKCKSTAYNINFANMLLDEIDKITKEDIKSAAQYIFLTPSLTSIVASQKTLDYFKSTLK